MHMDRGLNMLGPLMIYLANYDNSVADPSTPVVEKITASGDEVCHATALEEGSILNSWK